MRTQQNDNVAARPPARSLMRRVTALLLGGIVAVGAAVSPIHIGRAVVLTPLAVRVLTPPNPVLGADNRWHLAYELRMANLSPLFVTITDVQTLDPDRNGRVLGTLSGPHLAAMMRLTNDPYPCDCPEYMKESPGRTIRPAHDAILFLDVTLNRGARIPTRLAHRIAIGTRAPKSTAAPQPLTFMGVPTRVGPRAIVIAPPLRGSNWWAEAGCCDPYSYHRGSTLPIDGTIHVPERFAIDFEQLNPEGRVFSGDISRLSSYAYFGVTIHAVAPGVVVRAVNNQPEQVPGKLPSDQPTSTITFENAGGNEIVEKLGPHRFAFYAHMQPGSVRVKAGDRVRAGQVLGLLGNSGNSSAPHLHFHLMDRPSPLASNGLPYEFTSFRGQGQVTNQVAVDEGKRANILPRALVGPHRNQMPLNSQIVRFP